MPTYAYTCTACGHALEVKQSFTDDALTTCPECSGQLRKVFSNVGVVFKGSGFYRTDSRSGAKASDGGSSSSAESAKPADSPASAPAAPAPSSAPAAGSTAKGSGSAAKGSGSAA